MTTHVSVLTTTCLLRTLRRRSDQANESREPPSSSGLGTVLRPALLWVTASLAVSLRRTLQYG
jgi:hypothetical protein